MSELDSNQAEATALVRGGLTRSQLDETAEAIFATSSYVYANAAEAEAAFAGELDRFIYSRYGNPTVAMFEERLRLIEGAEACMATASGMSAIFASLASLVEAGDRVVGSCALFGSCSMIDDVLMPFLRHTGPSLSPFNARGPCQREWKPCGSAPMSGRGWVLMTP